MSRVRTTHGTLDPVRTHWSLSLHSDSTTARRTRAAREAAGTPHPHRRPQHLSSLERTGLRESQLPPREPDDVRVQRGKHRYVIPSNLDIKPYTSIAETPLRDLRNTGLRRAVGVAEPGPEGARAGAAAGRTRGAVRHFHARRYTQRRRDRVGVSERLWASPAGSLSAYTCRAVVCRAADTATVRDSAVVRPHEFTQRLHAPL